MTSQPTKWNTQLDMSIIMMIIRTWKEKLSIITNSIHGFQNRIFNMSMMS